MVAGLARVDRLQWWLAGLSTVLALIATARGPGLSPDSVNYLAAGVNLADGRGLRALDDSTLTVLAPGLSFVAAAGAWIADAPELIVRLVTAASAAGATLLVARQLRLAVGNRVVATAATALVAVSPVILNVTKMAWTEGPFIVIVLAFTLMGALAVSEPHRTDRWVAVMAVLVWLAFLFRYAGLSLVLAGGAVTMLATAGTAARRLVRTIAFVVVSCVVPIGWMLRNRSVDGALLGPRTASNDSIGDVLQRLVEGVGGWLVPIEELPSSALLAAGILALLALMLLAWLVWRAPHTDAAADTAPSATTATMSRAVGVSNGAFVIAYLGYLAAAQLTTLFDSINQRLLSPAFAPVVIVVALGIHVVTAASTASTRRFTGVAVAGLIAANALVAAGYAGVGVVRGIGFNQPQWTDSALAAAVVADADDSIVYSNRPPGLWAGSKVQPILQSPLLVGARGVAIDGQLASFANDVACADEPVLLAEFRQGGVAAVPVEEISAVLDVVVVGEFADGVLYAVSSGVAAECPER
ncbi:MAG: hypothetical protein AAFY28_16505 [Actinomycetota bacterium]